jgi:hypothetical protein
MANRGEVQERSLRIVQLRDENPNETMAWIAAQVGVSRERVRQVLARNRRRTTAASYGTKVRICIDCGQPHNKPPVTRTQRCDTCAYQHAVDAADRATELVRCDNPECGREFRKSRIQLRRQEKDPRYKGKNYCGQRCVGAVAAKKWGWETRNPRKANEGDVVRIKARDNDTAHEGHQGVVTIERGPKRYTVDCNCGVTRRFPGAMIEVVDTGS